MRPFATLLLLLLAAPAARAQSYLPLAIGNHWIYASPSGAHDDQTVTGMKTILGRTVFVITYGAGGANSGLENYWIPQPEGGVYLCGFWDVGAQFGILYDPPILYVNAPLELGKTWTVSVRTWRLPGMTDDGPLDLGLAVMDEADLALPAGNFHSFGLGQTLPPSIRTPAGSLRTLEGKIPTTGSSMSSDWFSAGVGFVQYQYGLDDPLQLTAFDMPTPVATVSWGRIKGQYR
jgi:hypothetical protein